MDGVVEGIGDTMDSHNSFLYEHYVCDTIVQYYVRDILLMKTYVIIR